MLGKAASEIGQELGRLGVQGQAELGSALFTGSAYVPYGQGQNREGAVHGMEGLHQEGKEDIQRENEGRSL
jgi:hypothetical protein